MGRGKGEMNCVIGFDMGVRGVILYFKTNKKASLSMLFR
jgi:hypothetical protein